VSETRHSLGRRQALGQPTLNFQSLHHTFSQGRGRDVTQLVTSHLQAKAHSYKVGSSNSAWPYRQKRKFL